MVLVFQVHQRPGSMEGQHAPAGRRKLADLIAFLILLGVAAGDACYFSAERNFWNSDSPRHAMNGVFVKDLIASHPFHNPVRYAVDYYLKYPALTIGLYPSLFFLLSAPFFALFGVSHLAALLPVTILFFVYITGCYAVARRWLNWPLALAAALAAAGAPEIAMWGRQVMLDIPSCAFQVWSVWCILRYVDTERTHWLYGAALCFVAAVYVKIPAVFLAVVLITALLLFKGIRMFRDRHVLICLSLILVALIPLAVATREFGRVNIASVTVHRTGSGSVTLLTTIGNWLWYLRRLPEQLGWPLLAVSLIGGLLVTVVPKWRLPWRHAAVLVTWFTSGYLFFSAIDLKGDRFDIAILFPLILCSALLVARLFPEPAAAIVGMTASSLVLISTLILHPVPSLGGYRAAAEYIAARSPRNSVILFSGYRDGSFIFNLRGQEARQDLSVIRSDKLLLHGLSVTREWGVEERAYSEQEILDLLVKRESAIRCCPNRFLG